MILAAVPKLREIGIEVETMALDAGYEGLPTAARLYGEDSARSFRPATVSPIFWLRTACSSRFRPAAR